MQSSYLWSVVVNEHKTMIDDQMVWVKELNFYFGDLQSQNINWEKDWRFCEVKGRRMSLKMLGVCKTTFPIKYPLVLTNGTLIESNHYYRPTAIMIEPDNLN